MTTWDLLHTSWVDALSPCTVQSHRSWAGKCSRVHLVPLTCYPLPRLPAPFPSLLLWGQPDCHSAVATSSHHLSCPPVLSLWHLGLHLAGSQAFSTWLYSVFPFSLERCSWVRAVLASLFSLTFGKSFLLIQKLEGGPTASACSGGTDLLPAVAISLSTLSLVVCCQTHGMEGKGVSSAQVEPGEPETMGTSLCPKELMRGGFLVVLLGVCPDLPPKPALGGHPSWVTSKSMKCRCWG